MNHLFTYDAYLLIRRKLVDDCGGCSTNYLCCSTGDVQTASCCYASAYECCGDACCYGDDYYGSGDGIDGETGTILGSVFGGLIVLGFVFACIYFYCCKSSDDVPTSSSVGNRELIRSPLAPIDEPGPSQMYKVVSPNGVVIRKDFFPTFSPVIVTVRNGQILLVYDQTTKKDVDGEVRVRASYGEKTGWATIWFTNDEETCRIKLIESSWNDNPNPIIASESSPSPSAPAYSSNNSSSNGVLLSRFSVKEPTSGVSTPVSMELASTSIATGRNSSNISSEAAAAPPPPGIDSSDDDPYASGLSVAEFQRRLEIKSLRERLHDLESGSS
jgi:hypothetical protein